MSGIHPEKAPGPATQGQVAARISTEIGAINRAFLTLVTDPLVTGRGQVLGLNAGLVARLAALDPVRRNRLASAPVLLADFATLAGDAGHSQPRGALPDQVAEDAAPAVWRDQVNAFANRLLTCLWHFSRLDSGLAGFCMGIDRHTAASLANMSFAELDSEAGRLCAGLQARHAKHPTCWPDLIRFAQADESERFDAACLGMIPLTVAAMNSSGTDGAAR